MLIVISLKHTKSITYYKLSLKAFKENLTKELLALDFSIFSLHLILAAGFIVMPLLIMENQIVSMIDNWQLVPAKLNIQLNKQCTGLYSLDKRQCCVLWILSLKPAMSNELAGMDHKGNLIHY